MNFDALRRHCAALPGATRDIKWGADEVYSVGDKMFAVFRIDNGLARTASFKCDPGRFLELTDLPGIVPAPYLARAHWVQIRERRALPDAAAIDLLTRSHELVLARLPRKLRDAVLAPRASDHERARATSAGKPGSSPDTRPATTAKSGTKREARR